MTSELYLQRHIFACSVPEVILLDLRQNRYVALPESQSRLLATLVPGWPVSNTAADPQLPTSAAAKIVDDLIARNILTRTSSQGKAATPAAITLAERTLLPEPQLIPQPSISTTQRAKRYLPAMAYSALMAAARLRFRSIERVVSEMTTQRNRRGRSAEIDTLIENFYWLRPLVFSGNQQCLFHSLTLLLFLHRFGLRPNWVFGVRKAPFGAHCWLQDGDAVLNDSVERVAMFTPIMVV